MVHGLETIELLNKERSRLLRASRRSEDSTADKGQYKSGRQSEPILAFGYEPMPGRKPSRHKACNSSEMLPPGLVIQGVVEEPESIDELANLTITEGRFILNGKKRIPYRDGGELIPASFAPKPSYF